MLANGGTMIKASSVIGALAFATVLPVAQMAMAGTIEVVVHNADSSVRLVLDDAQLARFPMKTYKAVLPSTDGVQSDVEGPLLRDVLAAAKLPGKDVAARALDNYEEVIPAEDYTRWDVLLVYKINGKTLSVRDKGPAWVVYPNVDNPTLRDPIYDARSVWQVKELVVE